MEGGFGFGKPRISIGYYLVSSKSGGRLRVWRKQPPAYSIQAL